MSGKPMADAWRPFDSQMIPKSAMDRCDFCSSTNTVGQDDGKGTIGCQCLNCGATWSQEANDDKHRMG